MDRRALGLLCGATFLFASARVWAVDGEVTGDLVTQFYDVRGPAGASVVPRRRLLATVGVFAYDILGVYEEVPRRRGALPELTFRARVRYDADFGTAAQEERPSQPDLLVPGFSANAVDLLYGYLEGRRLAGGFLGFRLGRQYVFDALGGYQFDGGLVRVTTPYFVAAEGYGGLEARGGMPFSTPRWERDGMWRGNRSGFDPTLYPSFQAATVAPVYGATLETVGLPFVGAKIAYRHVDNTGISNLTQFTSGLFPPAAYDGARLSSERVGVALDAALTKLGAAKGGLVYDAYVGRVSSAWASVSAFTHNRVTITADYDFYLPTFDADSIFSFFGAEPSNDVGLRGDVVATPHVSLSAGAHLRAFGAVSAISPQLGSGVAPIYSLSNGVAFNQNGFVAASYRRGNTSAGLRAAGSFGEGGQRVGADVFGSRWLGSTWVLESRLSVWQWEDALRPDRSATSVGYVLGVGYRFAPRCDMRVEWEHNINRLIGHGFRGLLSLNVAVMR